MIASLLAAWMLLYLAYAIGLDLVQSRAYFIAGLLTGSITALTILYLSWKYLP